MKKFSRLLFIVTLFLFIFTVQRVEVDAADLSDGEKEFLINFNPKNGEEAVQVKVKQGEQLTENQIPFTEIKNGDKDFLGWFYGEGNKYELIFPFTPDSDVVLSAKWGKHIAPSSIEKPGYRMIFNDEFGNTDGQLNPDLWVDKYLSSWTRTPEFASPVYELEDGIMNLQIREDTKPWAPEYDGQTVVSGFTTGNRNALHNWNKTNEVRNPVETEITHINQYGYYEMRAKTQAGSSRHAAWWLTGFEDEPGHAAEIDIFEVLGNDSTGVPRAFHSWNDNNNPFGSGGAGTYRDASVDFHNEWHVYAMDWQKGTGSGAHPDKLVFYVDGKEVGSRDTNINYPMIQLFSLYEKRAGGWTGNWEWMPYPNSFDIDYVRVYKELPAGQNELSKDQLKITNIEDSKVGVLEGQAKLTTYISKVEGSMDKVYTEPNLPSTKSYVNVTWNDGVITQEFVKWDPITNHDLELINSGKTITKKGVLPNLTNIPGLSPPTLHVEVIQGPPYTSENLGTANNQSQLARLFDGILASNSGEFTFASNQLPTNKEVNIQYDFKEQVTLNSIGFTTNYGKDQGIRKFKLATWDDLTESWLPIEKEYDLAWTPAGNTESGETLLVDVGSLETSKVKIIITDAGLTWGNKVAMREIEFDYTKQEPIDVDVTILRELIATAKAISIEDGPYTSESFLHLENAIQEAEVNLETVKTEAERDTLVAALQFAIAGLKKIDIPKDLKKDIAELVKLIGEAKAISNDDGKYSSSAFASLQAAIKAAQEALVSVKTEDGLEDAIDDLEDAIEDLLDMDEWKEDIADLKKLINKAKAISNDKGKYTTASFASLQKAIKVAQKALVNVKTEDELEDSIDDLEDAIDDLVKVKKK